jgi:peptide deformylase
MISKNKQSKVMEREGCLSFPFRPMIKVKRYDEIVVSYDIISIKNNLLGKPQLATGRIENRKLTGLAARVFQHEFEHLNGKSIFD